MNDFSARITLRRLAQTYTGVKKASDYGYGELVDLLRNRIAVLITQDIANEEFYNKRFDSYVKLCNSSRDLEFDLLADDLIGHFEDVTTKAGTSVERAFLTYSYVISLGYKICQRYDVPTFEKKSFIGGLKRRSCRAMQEFFEMAQISIQEKFGDLAITPDLLADPELGWLKAEIPSPVYLPGYESDTEDSS
ncbi:Oidioi.mRNA.OKI2018_I69.chr2.g6965.t1.cds [Oikopleura dioica]|uniref:Oidioi.mRNA.OKI2018_I69.XSR.g15464.t1.cds n=1 Tax=Oikopleura dioica TaxID=34765 RepID=A0ABN7TAS5_OIKDI|nr:Oidioi.mRNA.OKI2018_I69.XSR.g15464.t1.cds [Oikopleura dioica]CAG5111298.1 Oidioi.mRNA.OKI2018_I69.chr2.g5619.t1.cds [Oikopleura dioica]CAG5112789.1 Oidioi.mRNA.OKI2018_I69.chr2.g6965.t1.cds [Oikopleura dioica]